MNDVAQHRYREIRREDWIEAGSYVALFVAAVIVGAVFFLPASWYVWVILVVAGLILLVRWHAGNFGYRCPRCGNEFEISAFADFTGFQGLGRCGGWKRLQCPKCHEMVMATVIRKIEK